MSEPEQEKPDLQKEANEIVLKEQEAVVFDEILLKIKKRLPHLARPIALEEGMPPRMSRLNIFIISAILCAFLIWGSVTPILEVAIAPGQVIPNTFIKTVQHLEGGIIKEIYVDDGHYVKEGQQLLLLDEASTASELDQLSARETGLKIRAERLRAFGLNQKPDFNQFDKKYQNLITDQQAVFDMQSKNRDDQRDIILKQIEQKKSQLTMQMGRLKDFEHRTSFLTQQRDVIKGLYDKKLKTGSEYRAAEDALAEVLVDQNQAKNQIQESNQGIAEFETKLLELDTRLRNEALNEMGGVTNEVAQVVEAKTKLQDRYSRLKIVAPTSGIIKGLKYKTLQGVIQPGVEILEIVPLDQLEVEAKVQPKDAGRLREGQKVVVKVTAYDYAQHGGIDGTVKSISATTFIDDKNLPYYRVLINLSRFYVGKDASKNHLLPGMITNCEIETGCKTALEYLMKPITMAFENSFHEH